MIISKTPYRISFFGGGTDFPSWYKEHGGAVISTTIDKYCYISLRELPPFFEHRYRIIYSIIECVKKVEEIKHPAVREILKNWNILKGLEIHHDGDLPARSGLGSSSSFVVGLLHCLHAFCEQIVSKEQLAIEAIEVERDLLKENVGSQDQVAAAFGGFNLTFFYPDNSFRVEPLPLPKEKLKQLQQHLLLVFTGVSRFSSEIAEQQVQNTLQHKKEYFIIREMVDESVKILNSKRDITDFGKLLHESWLLKKSLSSKISTPVIDEIYEIARKNGATGGKVLGAGGGGFMLLFVPPEYQTNVKTKLERFLFVDFEFENNGSQIIFYQP